MCTIIVKFDNIMLKWKERVSTDIIETYSVREHSYKVGNEATCQTTTEFRLLQVQ